MNNIEAFGLDKSVLKVLGSPIAANRHAYSTSVLVDEGVDWRQTILAGFPETSIDGYGHGTELWNLGNQYPSKEAGQVVEREVIILDLDGFPAIDEAWSWGKQNELIFADPRMIWALGNHNPQLHRQLNRNRIALVSVDSEYNPSKHYPGHVPCGSWDDGKREADTLRPDDGWLHDCLFVFVREQSLENPN